MLLISLYTIYFYGLIFSVKYIQGQERKLSNNLQDGSTARDNSIGNVGKFQYFEDQNDSKDESFQDLTDSKISSSSLLQPETQTTLSHTKYPILIPKVSQEEIDEDDVNIKSDYQSNQTTASPSTTKDVPTIDGNRRDPLPSIAKRSCGDPKERCYFEGMTGLGRNEHIDFMREPFYCRCDRGTCDKYGDCCITAFNSSAIQHNNPWRCQLVQHDTLMVIWALMISKCKRADDPLREWCENPDLISEKKHTYLHDLPVYNNVSKVLYRNTYCAQCNDVPQSELYNMELQIRCSGNFTSVSERELFISRAIYVPGQRMWTDRTTACELYAPELDQYRISTVIPEIRFCRRNAIDYCPHNADPETSSLCSSYTQYVYSRHGPPFKNPHCAECHGVLSKTDLKCLHDKTTASLAEAKLSPSAAGANLGSTGLSFIFDFDLGRNEESYVGYNMICRGNSIWDFLRQKCTPIECPRGQTLDEVTGICGKNSGEHSDSSNPNPKTPESNATDIELSNSTSPCYILLIHQHEYTLLENKSILVNQSGNGSATLIFHPGEYKPWNSTTLAICARNTYKGFAEHFSPMLNKMSLATLGISVFFSTLHTIIFLILPKMRNLPGKNLFCLNLSLLISQLVFLTLIRASNKPICLIASITTHYFFLASFFWMNIMSLDIWRTFSSEFMMRRQSPNSNRTFIKYSIFAWTIPALIVGSASLIDFWIAEEYGNNWPLLRRIKPLYGHNDLCWISQGLSLFVFFALPVLLIICLNIVLFTLTAKAIMDQSQDMFFQNQCKKERKSPEKNKIGKSQQVMGARSRDEVDRMKLYVKLALIMGLTWILGFLTGMSGWDWLWYPFVVLNGLQGTFIFFAFDFKVKVWRMIKERFGWRWGQNFLKNKRMWRRNTCTTTNSTFGNTSDSAPVQISSVSNKTDV